MKILTALLIIFLLSGCATTVPGVKDKVAGLSVASAWLGKMIPGYRNRRLNRLDYEIDVKSRELRLEELRFETKKARIAYKGLE